MSEKTREDGRACNELRPITITRGWSLNAEGSALIEFGNTRVLCRILHRRRAPLAQRRRQRVGERRVRHAAARHRNPLIP